MAGRVSEGRQPTPSTTIDRLVDGVYPAMALLAAMQLDLFSAVAEGAPSSDEVARARGLDPSRTQVLLDALVAAELLTKKSGRYNLTNEAADHLVTSSPWSRVGGHEVLSMLWSASLATAESVRAGGPAQPHDYAKMPASEALDLLRGLRPDAANMATAMLDDLQLERSMAIADVGGGGGGAACAFVDLVAGVTATVVELPNIAGVSRTLLAEAGRADIEVVEADCTDHIPGNYDRIWAQFVTQTMGPSEAEALVLASAKALRPGGSIHLVSIVVDAARTSPTRAALFNIALTNIYHGGRAHSIADYDRWLRAAGMTQISWTPVNDMIQMVSAR